MWLVNTLSDSARNLESQWLNSTTVFFKKTIPVQDRKLSSMLLFLQESSSILW